VATLKDRNGGLSGINKGCEEGSSSNSFSYAFSPLYFAHGGGRVAMGRGWSELQWKKREKKKKKKKRKGKRAGLWV